MNRSLANLFKILLLLSALLVAGCQSSQQGESSGKVPLLPYSKGPAAPPKVLGPTQDLTQALSETEQVKITLPQN